MSYGKAAVDSVNEFIATRITNPINEMISIWEKKSFNLAKAEDCPKSTFLGLCSAGCVLGIPSLNYTISVKNRRYGEAAAKLLKAFPALANSSEDDLWTLVTTVLKACGVTVADNQNYQMNVVLGLWRAGLIV